MKQTLTLAATLTPYAPAITDVQWQDSQLIRVEYDPQRIDAPFVVGLREALAGTGARIEAKPP